MPLAREDIVKFCRFLAQHRVEFNITTFRTQRVLPCGTTLCDAKVSLEAFVIQKGVFPTFKKIVIKKAPGFLAFPPYINRAAFSKKD